MREPTVLDLNRELDFVARDRPLSEVLTELNDRYHLPVVAEIPAEDMRVNVQCEKNSISSLLDEIAAQAKMKWQVNNGYIVFSWRLSPLRPVEGRGPYSRSRKAQEMLDFWNALSTTQRSQLSKAPLPYQDLTAEQQKELGTLIQRQLPPDFGLDASEETWTALRMAFFPSMTIQSQGKTISSFAVRTLSGSQRSLLFNKQTGEITVLPPGEVWFTFEEGTAR